ncbi:MAG TPA: hypothetical protein VMK12_20380 [Anaeromyxobacteraceae bacterium]|nr:hypothetical protein [Anaeromyxobacteraceae bacterium]
MSMIAGESVKGLPREVEFERVEGKPGWVRVTIVLKGKNENRYIVLLRLADLKRAVSEV